MPRIKDLEKSNNQKNNSAFIALFEKDFMCSGAFLLALSGLLDGKKCSTNWAFANAFRTMFPVVDLQTAQLITDENGIYTNGGACSFLNLAIYLEEKYYDRQTFIYYSKIFQIEMDRNSPVSIRHILRAEIA